MPAMLEVSFQNPSGYRGLGLRELRHFCRRLTGELADDADSLAVRFVSDREMRALNSRYRDLDESTDVLSFPGERGLDGYHIGDVVISVPTARRQARAACHDLETEVEMLVLHGLLHCLGYDHETDDGQMVRLERRLRRKFVELTTARKTNTKGRTKDPHERGKGSESSDG